MPLDRSTKQLSLAFAHFSSVAMKTSLALSSVGQPPLPTSHRHGCSHSRNGRSPCHPCSPCCPCRHIILKSRKAIKYVIIWFLWAELVIFKLWPWDAIMRKHHNSEKKMDFLVEYGVFGYPDGVSGKSLVGTMSSGWAGKRLGTWKQAQTLVVIRISKNCQNWENQKLRSTVGFEPTTSRTQSGNHASRPCGLRYNN